MPTLDSVFKTNDTSNRTTSRGIRGNLPQERASYGAKRRQMDLDVREFFAKYYFSGICFKAIMSFLIVLQYSSP